MERLVERLEVLSSAVRSRCSRATWRRVRSRRRPGGSSRNAEQRGRTRGSSGRHRPGGSRRSGRRRHSGHPAWCSTPSAVDAFPWGSRSITSTRAPDEGEGSANVDGGRRLADTTLLVGDREDPSGLRQRVASPFSIALLRRLISANSRARGVDSSKSVGGRNGGGVFGGMFHVKPFRLVDCCGGHEGDALAPQS